MAFYARLLLLILTHGLRKIKDVLYIAKYGGLLLSGLSLVQCTIATIQYRPSLQYLFYIVFSEVLTLT
jgi:hypothetical protein